MKKSFIILLLFIISSSAFASGQKFRNGVFLHYTIGERIWGPNGSSTSVPNEINLYNNSHSFTGNDTFKLTEEIFPADEQNNEWYRWREIFENTRSTADIMPYINANKIIMVKSNYLSSEMTSWGAPSDTNDPTKKSVYNYKWLWRKLINKMREYGDKFFVIWTNAPLAICPDSQALLVHYFCKWAKDTLATGKDASFGKFPINVFVFDYFHKVTDANSKWKLKTTYSAVDNVNYPNSAATAYVAPLLVQESFNSILIFENYFNPDMISVPILVSPADTAKNVVKNIILKWRKVQFATRYSVQIALDTGFTTIIESDNSVIDTFYTANNLYYNTKYYWRVKCYNYGGGTNWSSRRSFTTVIAPPGIPQLIQPSDKQANLPVNVYFSWSQSVPAAEKYRFQLAKNSNFSNMLLDSQNITVNSIMVLNKLDSSTTYYWRIKAINIGGESLWSTVWSFTTIVAFPANVTLVQPQDNAANIELKPVFKWNRSARASKYIYQIANDNLFNNLVENDSSVTDTIHLISLDLQNDMQYYWRVMAVNTTGNSPWSLVRTFHTIKAIPDTPLVLYPANGEINVPVKPVFRWNIAKNAERYSIQLSHDEAFENKIYDNVIVQDTSYSGDIELQRNQIYWWRLKAMNFAGESDWSASASFTTLVLPPAATMLLTPGQGDTGVSVQSAFTWNLTPGAETYNFQIAKEKRFLVLIVNKTLITDTTYTLETPLEYLTEYFWRVKGVNPGGEGDWSNYLSFTTEMFTSVGEAEFSDIISAYPNPFTNAVELKINVKEPGVVTGRLYAINGQEICNFVNQWFDTGEHIIKINGSSFTGLAGNNILICKLRTGNKSAIIKLIRN